MAIRLVQACFSLGLFAYIQTAAVDESLSDYLWRETSNLRQDALNSVFVQGLKNVSLDPIDFGSDVLTFLTKFHQLPKHSIQLLNVVYSNSPEYPFLKYVWSLMWMINWLFLILDNIFDYLRFISFYIGTFNNTFCSIIASLVSRLPVQNKACEKVRERVWQVRSYTFMPQRN